VSDVLAVESTSATKKPKVSSASILAASAAHFNQVKPQIVSPPPIVDSTELQVSRQVTSTPTAINTAKTSKAAKVAKQELPHVLIWVSHNGTRPGSGWTNKSLKIVGVYGSKVEAENKKNEIKSQYDTAGYGGILVGDTCWDEIDLIVRPAGECTL